VEDSLPQMRDNEQKKYHTDAPAHEPESKEKRIFRHALPIRNSLPV